MSQPQDGGEEVVAAFSQGMSEEIPSFSQESIELERESEEDDGLQSLSQVQTLSQDMREADAISLSQSSQASYIPAYSHSQGAVDGGEGNACRITLCFRPLGPDVRCEPLGDAQRTGSVSFHFGQDRTGPHQLVEHGWQGPSLVSTATIELSRQNGLEHTQLVLPRLDGWDFRALIVVLGRQMFVWPVTTRTQVEVAPSGMAEYTFRVSDAHHPLDERRRRKNYITMPCFGEVGVSATPNTISPMLEHYLDTYPGFAWHEAWVDELGYANSGRVLRFAPTGGATAELKWPVDCSTVLRAGAYELSMYVLVDEGYETLPMFRASFELENERFGKHTLFTGCRGTRHTDPKAARASGLPGQPGYWQQVTARVTLPSDALAFDFTIIGAGKIGRGGFYATGLSLYQIGKRLQVSVQQADGREIVNRDTRIEGPDGDASMHSVEMSLLGHEAANGMRRASFNLSVGYFDVSPNVDDDSLLVRFTVLWKAGLTGKEQLMAEHLNPAYYSKRLIRTDYKEDPFADKPTGLAGFDQVVLHARDRPGAMLGTQNELYVMRRGLPFDGGTSSLEIGLDNFFEPCGDPQIDAAHKEARARGELVGYTQLGKLKVLGIDLWSSCGLWPSKKATHKGGLGKRAAGSERGGTGGRDAAGGGVSPSAVTDGESDATMDTGSVDLADGAGSASTNTDALSGLGVKRKVDQLEAANPHVSPDNGYGNHIDDRSGTLYPIQPPEHKAIDSWKFPAKRILLQVDLPARFWDGDRGTRLYVDFRSQESKDTKRHRELGAIPDGEEGAVIKRDRETAAAAAVALRGCFRAVDRETDTMSVSAAAAPASSGSGSGLSRLPAAIKAADSDGDASPMIDASAADYAALDSAHREDSGSAINALTALAGMAM